MSRRNAEDEYFEWMFQIVCGGRYSSGYSYRELLTYLYNTEFTYLIPKDRNRAEDGVDLRYRYYYTEHRSCEKSGPCSVLEMILALAIRCEETIMDDPSIGDRTGQWFWKMIVNLGLGGMTDNRFDPDYVRDVVDTFLNREYEPDGRGGLFTIRNCEYDLRDVEIWTAMLWFLDSIT